MFSGIGQNCSIPRHQRSDFTSAMPATKHSERGVFTRLSFLFFFFPKGWTLWNAQHHFSWKQKWNSGSWTRKTVLSCLGSVSPGISAAGGECDICIVTVMAIAQKPKFFCSAFSWDFNGHWIWPLYSSPIWCGLPWVKDCLISQMIYWHRCFQCTGRQDSTSPHQSHCTLEEHMPIHPCCSHPCLWTCTINTCPRFQLSFLETHCLEQMLRLEIQIQNQAQFFALSNYLCIGVFLKPDSWEWVLQIVIFLKAAKGFYKNIWGFMPHELCNLKLNRYCIKASKQQL